jgi:alkyl sulfatase BDS1-like metallo-beta-lactamase superfamily hydrolase
MLSDGWIFDELVIILFYMRFLMINNLNKSQKDATKFTIEANKKILDYLPFENINDIEDANANKEIDFPADIIYGKENNVVMNFKQFNFLNSEKSPETVNPSLWRQSQLVNKQALYKVTEGIYQVRNIDLSNITFIRGNTGWIVIDTMTSTETANAALNLVNETLSEKLQLKDKTRVSAVIITHSHVDHFGGIKALINEKDVIDKKVEYIAPAGFSEEALSENILAGNVMSRRASYMYGNLIDINAKGGVGCGLGLATSQGTISFMEPNKLIDENSAKVTQTVDGVKVVYLMAEETEAPAEMLFYFPDHKAICLSEDINHTLHNTLTMRGAKVRNPAKWSKVIDEVIQLWGNEAQYSFGSHHWPQFGNASVVKQLNTQRNLYKYINDQTLRLANQGLTMHEIAENFVLPDSLAKEFTNRGYYGNLKHNVRATYQLYQGWWDGNPSNYDPLTPSEEAKKYVEMIGEEKILESAHKAFENGDYRWAATLTNKLVFANPKNQNARYLGADALEQLGYQAESGAVRNYYLTGAKELRDGTPNSANAPNTTSSDIINGMSTEMFLDYMAVHLNPAKTGEEEFKFNLNISNNAQIKRENSNYLIAVQSGVLLYWKDKKDPNANGTIEITNSQFKELFLNKDSAKKIQKNVDIKYEGDKQKLITFLGAFEKSEFWFPIVEPKTEKKPRGY